MTTADNNVIGSLAEWDTPALSNALDALRLRPHNTGYSDGSIQRITGAAPMAGRAVTARMVAREPGDDGIGVSHLHDVTVAGLTVHPGDLLHADEHGVLQIPAEALPGIIEKAEMIREDEQNIVRWSRSADFSVGKVLQLRRARH